jgi:hypothetical protein
MSRARIAGRRLEGEVVGLPPRVFLYSLDQIAAMIDVPITELVGRYVFFDGRSEGSPRQYPRSFMARNISPEGESRQDWRVAEKELIRWLRHIGFRIYEVGYIKH